MPPKGFEINTIEMRDVIEIVQDTVAEVYSGYNVHYNNNEVIISLGVKMLIKLVFEDDCTNIKLFFIDKSNVTFSTIDIPSIRSEAVDSKFAVFNLGRKIMQNICNAIYDN